LDQYLNERRIATVVSEQLAESLRHEIENYLQRRVGGLKEEIAQLQHQLDQSLKQILERDGESQWDGSLAATIAEHLRAAHERGIELAAAESARAQGSSDMAIVKAAIEELEGHQSQTEILKALVNRASSFAPRTVFFVIKAAQARGWRARGFQGTVGDEVVQQISFPLLADTVIGAVAQSRTTWSGPPNSHSEDQLLLHRLGEQAPQRIVAVPLVVRGRAVAVLYADSAGLDSDAINLEALEALVRVAGMAVGLLSISQATAARPPAESTVAPPGPAPETVAAESAYIPEREYEAAASAEPAPAAAEASETEPAAAETSWIEPAAAEASWTEPAAVETSETEPAAAEASWTEAAAAEPSTRVDEATVAAAPTAEPVPLTADSESIQTAPVSVPMPLYGEPAVTPALGARRRYDAALPVEVTDDEERRQHNDARRFARLLVSEIKLYNEQKVVEGRSEGDLYGRLREYIDRSREMYDKRVKSSVSTRYDYFHHELVNTLAEGDASKLGEAYPGTTVSA
jgi:hypothetical protein